VPAVRPASAASVRCLHRVRICCTLLCPRCTGIPKFYPLTAMAICAPEMTGLWNFSVRVQSWSDKIESDPVLVCKIFENHPSDPVLIRQCKIMYFYFASWGKRTTRAILHFAEYDWLKAKYFQQCFCLMWLNRRSLLAFPKFNKEVSIRHQREKHCWSYFAVRRVRLLGLAKWQGRYTWISVKFLLHDLKP